MAKWKSWWRQILRCFLVPLVFLAVAMPTADAADAWYVGATPIFRHVELPGDIVPTAMLQDREGLIWIASQTGLASWDGYHFHGYVANPGVPGSLPSSCVNALHEDREGRLWVGTDSGGLARLDKATGIFWTLGAGPQGLSSPSVFALAADGADGLWVGTAAGLDRLNFATGKVRHQAEGGIPPGLPARRVNALLVDRYGNLWVGTAEGVYVLRTVAQAFQPVPTAGITQGAVEVWKLAEDGAGRVWVGTQANGAFVIEPGTTTARQVRDSERTDGKGVETYWVSAIIDAGDAQVWLGTWSQGIVQVDTQTWTTRRLRHDPGLLGSLAKDDVPALLRDRSGLVWAVGPNLFDSIDPTQRAISTWYGNDGYLLGGTQAGVTAMLVRPDDSVWLGGSNGGVEIVLPNRERGRLLAAQDGVSRMTLPKAAVYSMAEGPNGSVYIGTAKGLYRTRDGARSVERMEFPGRPPTALVRAIRLIGDRLWIGGTNGLSYVDLSAQGAAAQSVPGLESADIMTVSGLEDGSLWVGTSTGLVRYWPATRRLERPWPEDPERVGLPGSRVTSVVQDRRGRLWVAFYGAGVRVVEPGARGAAVRVHRVGHEQGLRNNAANALLLDAQGNAWVSTDSGILRIDSNTLTTTLLQEADGVGLLPYWTLSAGATPEGDLLFGGSGLTVVHPGEFHPSPYKAPIVLTDQDGRPISPSGITLGASQRTVQVTFALLDYTSPERTRYAYRLAGLEDAWTDSPADLRIAHYTNVPPGNYTLQVRASNRAGEWSASANLPIRVVPAWYETIFFRVIMAALLLALFGMLMQVRTRLLRGRAAALETLIAQRTQELQQRSDELVRRTAELQASEQRLEQLAYFDGLTGLANRRHFNDDLQHLVEQARRGTDFALVLVDLDRFKPINDAYGHDAGDAVLKAVGSRLRLTTREVDLVSRLGGDEFAVLLSQPGDREAVAAVCERIIAMFAQPIPYRSLSLEVRASIGVAQCPQDARDATALYKAADVALYAAKEAGRGAWRWAGAPFEVDGSSR
ncbi:ligand-binding sensor domain-containing diguanylate cyclase [Paraburkholderia phenazinium]|uniref:Diguanylate cyclase (GGDEF) domain-containing protein n=1 Tax=Paraburkholderia phenazinium TaxID=60549 RepID=A0A1G8ITL7_9BURK|nr:ligand-binding sensor domain-containing diguanylate cyclase [Paraburkholderia phenazinium]SDI22314.1 diguanylate cyclase (GGDEF) domain-containing protein [Paraburkholderia phenazinium]